MAYTLKNQLSKVGEETICPVAVILKDGKILMGYRHYTADKWKDVSVWTLPGGRCDKKETLEQTLRREVQEETGITDLNIIDFIGEIPGGKQGDTVSMFYCETRQEYKLMEPEKFSEWRWVDFDDYTKGYPEPHINSEAKKMVVDFFKKIGIR